jgi:hypothetical protein
LKGFQKDNVSIVELTLTNFLLSNAVAIELTLLVEDTNYSLASKRNKIFFYDDFLMSVIGREDLIFR